MKSPVNSYEISFKRKGNDYDKQYDAKKWKRNFQLSWLTEFPWLALDADLGITGCDISTHPLSQESVESVRRAQIIDHSPVS